MNARSIAAKPIWKKDKVNVLPITRKALVGKCSSHTYLAKIDTVTLIEMKKVEAMHTPISASSLCGPTVIDRSTIINKVIDHDIIYTPLLDLQNSLIFLSHSLGLRSIVIELAALLEFASLFMFARILNFKDKNV